MTAFEMNEAGYIQARRRAEYELGDANWAGIILRAYFNPEQDAREMADDD